MNTVWPLTAWHRLPPVVVDALVATGMAALVCVAIEASAHPPTDPPAGPLGYLLGVGIGAVLLVRRRHPLAVLTATAVLLFVYYAVGGPGFEPALPLAVVLYTAAAAGHPWWAAAVAGFYGGAEVLVRGTRLGDPALNLLGSLVQEGALLGMLILLGVVVRARAARLGEARTRLAEWEAGRAQEAARLVAEERLRIAREVHDILGHALSALVVQAGLVADVIDGDRERAREAVRTVLGTARAAMTELKATVGLLRDPAGQRSPTPCLADLDALAEIARRGGVQADVHVDGARRDLPAVIEMGAYRIAQESLTNVVRHSGAGHATLVLRYTPTELVIEVGDDGRGCTQPADAGHGLTGMAERAAALGGTLHAGPRSEGGFAVRARLPLEGA